MPIHDWSRVDHGVFHDFHQAWTIAIRDALNGGMLPSDYFAMTEQFIRGPAPDVVTLHHPSPVTGRGMGNVVALAERPPKARFVMSAEDDVYVANANVIKIRHRLGEVVAVLEIVSPGNKSAVHAIRAFVTKSEEFIRQGIHMLVIDLLPPTARDPQGIHKEIWDTIKSESYEHPTDKPLTVVSYYAGQEKKAYVEPLAVGDLLPSHPIFLDALSYVPAPLEDTYAATWAKLPEVVRRVVLGEPV